MKMLACITVERSVLCGSLVGEVSCAFHSFFEDEKESRRKALALFAPMPIHSSPQCELPQGFAGFGN